MTYVRFYLFLLPCFLFSYTQEECNNFYQTALNAWNLSESYLKRSKQVQLNHEELTHLYKEAWNQCQYALQHIDIILKNIQEKSTKKKTWYPEMKTRCEKDRNTIDIQMKYIESTNSTEIGNYLNQKMLEKEKSLQNKKEENSRSFENQAEIVHVLNSTSEKCTIAADYAYGILILNPFPFLNQDRSALEIKRTGFLEEAKRYKQETNEWPRVLAQQKEELKNRWLALREECQSLEKKGLQSIAYAVKRQIVPILEELVKTNQEVSGELGKLKNDIANFEKESIVPEKKIFLSPEAFALREKQRRELFYGKISSDLFSTATKSRPLAMPLDGQRKRDEDFAHYTGQFYRVLLQSNKPVSHLNFKIYQKKKLIHEEKVEIPKKNSLAWERFLTSDGMMYIPETDLKQYGIDLRISDIYDPSCPYSFVIAKRGLQPDYQCTISIDESVLYTATFLEPPPWQLEILQKPFRSSNKPLERNSAKVDASLIQNNPIQHPEISRYPLLDRLVEELKKDPIAIAKYIQNEISLIDPFLVQEKGIFYAPGIQRSALMTFLEKQGTPWEQCMLLVYLLRQAGYQAVYADGVCTLPKSFVENMLFIDLPEQEEVLLQYPWVNFFDGKDWVSLFPWMKEMQIHEGYDLYNLMSKEYASSERWISHYLQSDPEILKQVGSGKDDSAGLLFVRFVEEELKKQGLSLSDVGMERQVLKKQYVSWEDFPRPVIKEKPSTIVSLKDSVSLFARIAIEIQNPKKRMVVTGTVKPEELIDTITITSPTIAFDCLSIPIEFILNGDQTRLYVNHEKSLNLDPTDSHINITITYANMVPHCDSEYAKFDCRKTFIIEKGTSCALCFHFGGDSPEITAQYHKKFVEEKDPSKKVFALLGFVGAAYFEKCSHMDRTLASLHKSLPNTVVAFGLAKLTPNVSKKNEELLPQVDMIWGISQARSQKLLATKANQRQFLDLTTVDHSSNEHQIIQDIFQDPAISTVKLMQLAHEEHKKKGLPGEGFLIFTPSRVMDTENIPEVAKILHFPQLKDLYLRQMKWESLQQWNEVKRLLDPKAPLSDYAFAYTTPGLVINADGIYKESGTFIFNPNEQYSLISDNHLVHHGGLGSPLPKEYFSPSAISQWQLLPYNNSYTLQTPTNPLPNISQSPVLTRCQSDVRAEHKSPLSFVADPVDVVTGAFYVDEVDLLLPGPFHLEIRRNYNSQNPFLGIFGIGWKLSLNPFLIEQDGKLYAAEMDGTVIAYRFNKDSTRYEVFPDDNPDLFNINPQGVGTIFNPFHAYIENNILYGSDGSKRIFEKGLLQKWIHPNGSVLNFTYSGERLNRIESSFGEYCGFHYNSEGKISEIFSKDGRRIYYRYNAQGDLTEVSLPNKATILYEYDGSHRIIKETKPHGKILENKFDSAGRITEQFSPKGPQRQMVTTASFTYEDNLTKVKDAIGACTTYHFFKKQIYKIIDPLNFVILQSWFIDKNHWFDAETEKSLPWEESGGALRSLKSSKDKRGLITSYLYDNQGNPTQIALQGDDLSGNKKTKISKKIKYNAQNLPIEEETFGYKTLTRYDEKFPYLPKKVEKYCESTLLSYVEWQYNSNGQMAKEDCSGDITLWKYDERGFPIKKIQVTGTDDPNVVTDYLYNHQGQCIQKTTVDGIQKNDFDIVGNCLESSIHSREGKLLSTSYMTYNFNNQLMSKQGIDEKDIVYFDYDPSGLIKATRQSLSPGNGIAYTLYEYDALDHLTQEVDPLGHCTYREYDALGRVIKETKENVSTSFSYEAGGLVETILSPSGAKTTRYYTTNGLLKEEIFSDGTKNSYVYDDFGRPLQETKNGITWNITYDDPHHRIIRTHKESQTTEITEVDLKGNLIRFHDALGNIVEKTYDGLHRLKTQTSPSGEKTAWNYQGNKILTTFANKEKKEELYEGGQIVETKIRDSQDHLLYSRVLQLEAEKNIQTITEGEQTTTIYLNAQGLPIQVQKGDLATSYEYDAIGNCTAIIDGEGKRTLQKFDVFGRLIQKEFPDGTILDYSYDLESNLIEYHLPNQLLWKASYDSMGQKISEELQKEGLSSQHWEYGYEHGDLKQTKDPLGHIHSYAYDSLGRLILEKVNENERKYTYDLRGQLTSIEQSTVKNNAGASSWVWPITIENSKIERSYDQNGRIILESVYLNNEFLHQTQQSWSPSSRSLHIGNHTRDFIYQNNQLVEISTKNIKLCYGYETSGALKSKTSPLIQVTMEHNQAGLPQKITTSIPGSSYEEVLSWNALGKLSNIQSPNGQRQFTYTKQGFIERAGDESYEFDFGKAGLGVRTASNKRKISPEGLDEFGKVILEMAEKTLITTTYDAMGQVVSDASKQLEWDFWGRLIKVTDSNSTWEASYDGLGRRIQTKHTPSWSRTTTTTFFHDPEEEFKEIGVAIGDKIIWKMFGPDGCDALEDERGETAYLVHNGQKELSKIVTSQEIISCDAISAYGSLEKPILEPNLISYAKSLTWHSQSQDQTGFIYLGARYYNPESGRFLSPDPVSYPQVLDLYAYGEGDPINNVDLEGRFASHAYQTIKETTIGAINNPTSAFKGMVHGVVDFGMDSLQSLSSLNPLTFTSNRIFNMMNLKNFHENLREQIDIRMMEMFSIDRSDSVYQSSRSFTRVGLDVGSLVYGGWALKSASRVASTSIQISKIAEKELYRAESLFQGQLLKTHLKQVEKYGSIDYRQLSNGKMRYYGELKASIKEGEMIGRRRVREWDPKTGLKRTWHEILDENHNIRIVRPETNNGIKTHYVFDREGNFKGTR